MFIDPREAIDQGWIKFPQNLHLDTDKYIQPNAIDFTIDRLFELKRTAYQPVIMSETEKQMRTFEEIPAVSVGKLPTPNWDIVMPGFYDAMSNFHVNLPQGVAAMLIIRSSFNRNGVFLTSGLYDSGFNNNIGFMLHVQHASVMSPVTIQQGVRVGQIIFIKSEDSGKLYDGVWNSNTGQHWQSNIQ